MEWIDDDGWIYWWWGMIFDLKYHNIHALMNDIICE